MHGRAGEIHAKAAGALLPALLLQVCMHVASALCRHVLGRSFRDQSAAQKHKPGVLLLQRAGAGAGAGASRPRRKLHAGSSVVQVQALLACPYPLGSTLLHVYVHSISMSLAS